MNRKLQLLLLCLLFCSKLITAQGRFPQQVNTQLNRYLLENLQEKLYLQTNSNNYLAGDTIWFKTTLTNAVTHTPVGNELMYYVDLISPGNKVVCHQVFAFEGGFSGAYLALNKQLAAGTYKILAYTNYMRNFRDEFLFQKSIQVLASATGNTDWEFQSRVVPYSGGDSVFVSLYARPANGREINEPVDIRVQLARGTIFGAPCAITNNQGRFSFTIPDSLKLPAALLTVHQTNAGNQSSKYQISLSVQKPDLQFLPEGGELVSGQENRVAFRCVDADGNPIPVEGTIFNQKGKAETHFASSYRGMGSLQLNPLVGEKYRAQISYRDSLFSFDLPEVKPDAYSFQLLDQTPDSIHLSILKSSPDTATYLLLAHCRGNIRFMGGGQSHLSRLDMTIPCSELSEGINTITLFVNRVPRAERLVYVDRNESIQFKLLDRQGGDNPWSPVKFSLKASRPDGSPVLGSFSVLAYNPQLEHSLDSLENIRNYLLFSSDLQGEVLSNTDVFNPTDPEYLQKRELMLLTRGWRRFSWLDVASYVEGPKTYPMEKGIFMEGRVYRMLNGKPVPKNFEISIILKGKQVMHVDKAYTDENGAFRFSLPAFTDSAQLTIQTRNRLDAQRDYQIEIRSNLENKKLNAHSFDRIQAFGTAPLVLNLSASNQTEKKTSEPAITDKAPKLRKPRIDNYYFPGKDTFMIEEVEARSNFLNHRDSMINQSGQPDVVIESAQLKKLTEERGWYSNLWDLLSDQVTGLQISQMPYMPWLEQDYNLVLSDEQVRSSVEVNSENMKKQQDLRIPAAVTKRDPTNYSSPGGPAIYFRVSDNPDGLLLIFVDHTLLNASVSVPLYDFLSYMDPADIESINFIAKPKNYDISMTSAQLLAEVSLQTVRLFDDAAEESGLVTEQINQMELMQMLDRVNAPPAFLFITTKSKGGLFYQRAKGIQSLYLAGLTAPREFYAPKYANQAAWDANKAVRKTIYWTPNVLTDSTGVTSVSFTPGVDLKNMVMQIQGLSLKGESGSQLFHFNPEPEAPTNQLLASTVPVSTPAAVNPYEKFRLYYGQICDAESGNPLAFVDISQGEPYYHERTNSSGEFFLSTDRLRTNRTVRISSPGYVEQEITLPDKLSSPLQIKLKKAAVQAIDPSRKALEIVRNAIRETRKLYASEDCFQGFNRETVTIDDNTYGIYEMAFNFSNAGYAYSPSSIRFETMKFKNMEDKNGHRLMMLKPNHRGTFYPMKTDLLSVPAEFWQVDNLNQFDYEQIGRVEYDGELCSKIRFTQNDKLVLALQSGVLYIGTQSGVLRYASWSTSPDKRQYLSYTSFLQSNPMDYDVKVQDDYNEASYTLQNGHLYLQSTNRQIRLLVNGQNTLEFTNRLSVAGKIARDYKEMKNRNTDTLIEDQKAKHMLVKDAVYQPEPWINAGLIKPEDKLVRDASFLHDITENQ